MRQCHILKFAYNYLVSFSSNILFNFKIAFMKFCNINVSSRVTIIPNFNLSIIKFIPNLRRS